MRQRTPVANVVKGDLDIYTRPPSSSWVGGLCQHFHELPVKFEPDYYLEKVSKPATGIQTRSGSLQQSRSEVTIYQPSRDADAWWKNRKSVRPIPVRVFQLVWVDVQFATRILRFESYHQRMRKRPGLTAKILNVPDADSRLFRHLPGNRFLQRFSRFHESSEDAIHARRQEMRTGQQQFSASTD